MYHETEVNLHYQWGFFYNDFAVDPKYRRIDGNTCKCIHYNSADVSKSKYYRKKYRQRNIDNSTDAV